MAGIISVSTEKLDKIGEYVDDFQKKILMACDNLTSAVNELKRSNSEEDVYDVDNMLKEVQKIIENEQDTFNQLKKSIETYSNKVKRMKTILGK